MEASEHHKDNGSAEGGGYHVPVLLHETVDGLSVRPDGIYVDATLGGGGHTREILQRLGPQGRLFSFDQDEEAIQQAPADARLICIRQNFRHVARFLRVHQVTKIDGLLADLGVSSHQFDEPQRGFSIRFDAPLDMRMDIRQSLTAAELVHTYTEQQLHQLFEKYGEVTNARTLARRIAEKRQLQPLDTIFRFREAIREVVVGHPQKYLAKVFQALRIAVNDELGALEVLLLQLPDLLKPGGRAAIITFHSLEDRMVKQFFKSGRRETEDRDILYGTRTPDLMRPVTRKPVEPSPDEVRQNPRSRSARLRIAERL